MKLCRTIAIACAVAAYAYAAAAPARAQQPASEPLAAPLAEDLFGEPPAGESGPETAPEDDAAERVPMFSTPGLGSPSSSGSSPQRSLSTAEEIRQARAQYRARQRMARIEARKWQGYEPLRPNWNAVPMMSSRHTARRVIQVPVYVPAR